MSQRLNYIGGEWVSGKAVIHDMNPSDLNDEVGQYAAADAAQTAHAIAAAKTAFAQWSAATPQQRFDCLDAIGTEILARRDELGRLLSREEGKPLADGIGEAARAGYIFKFFAGEALRIDGNVVASVRAGVDIAVTREPLGVVGLITPWNFPAAIPAWKIAPALAYGNTVVFKPAELVPATAWAIIDIAARSGLPKGVLNLVMGKGSIVGQAIIDSRDVAAVSFTGSQAVGARIAQSCAARGAKFQLEMGGKNPLVVLDDADLPLAVAAAVNGAFYQTGQRCTASSRLIATRKIHDKFVDGVIAAMKELKVDNALEPGTQVGPVVDDRQLAQDMEYLDIGRAEGAELAWGGERLNRATNGHYLQPALFVNTKNDMRINREEIFGPIASVIRVDDYDQALAIANDTGFGLSSGIFTTSLKHAAHFRKHSEAGMVMVNLPTAGVDYHVPFGGSKGSSYGPREQGRQAVEFFTASRTHYVLSG
ncbi:MAG TPA: aldehyde dehydrogenase family protein [Aestuariivirgaceae bacterium]|nr:aldehyde dehydrogenase family protein [Aestuariivirgaceae bacterium]